MKAQKKIIRGKMSGLVFRNRLKALFRYIGPDPRWENYIDLAAYILGRNSGSIWKWTTGERPIPLYAWRMLNMLSALAELGGKEAVLYGIMDPETAELVSSERKKEVGLRS